MPLREYMEGSSLSTDGSSLDRRQAIRYPLPMPVTFLWNDIQGKPRQDQGLTRDIGLSGEFVLAGNCPAEGAPISLDILLPRAATAMRALRIQVEGTVVRVDHAESSARTTGFAVLNQRTVLAERP